MTFSNCCCEPSALTEVVAPKPLPFGSRWLNEPWETRCRPRRGYRPADVPYENIRQMAIRERGGHPLDSRCKPGLRSTHVSRTSLDLSFNGSFWLRWQLKNRGLLPLAQEG